MPNCSLRLGWLKIVVSMTYNGDLTWHDIELTNLFHSISLRRQPQPMQPRNIMSNHHFFPRAAKGMPGRRLAIRLLVTAGICLPLTPPLNAATLQTYGPGSAVSSVDRSANFDQLTSVNIVHLENYTDSGLSITTSADSWAADLNMSALLDPFHGANGADRAFYAISAGNQDWVTIQATNLAVTHGIEFMYGNTWTTGDAQYPWGNANAVLEWQTWLNQALVSTNVVGPTPLLNMGTVIGFYDPAGFDQLLIRATISTSGDPTLQAVALDHLNVMFTNQPPAPVIYGSDFGIAPATGIASLTVYDTIPGCQYRMVWTESLTTPAWSPVTPPLPEGWQAGGGTLTFTDPGAPGRPRRFYRVEVR